MSLSDPGGQKSRGEMPPSRTSHRLTPSTADAARRSSAPDSDTYDRQIPNRATPANLALSIVVVVLVAALAIALLLVIYFWRPTLTS